MRQLNPSRSCLETPQLLSEQGLWVLERGSGCTNPPKPWHSCAQLCHDVGACAPPWDPDSPWEDLGMWGARWLWSASLHRCQFSLPVDALHVRMVPIPVAQPTCWWSLAASPINPLPACQGQAAGTQTFAHPEKLPHTLQLAELLVLRHQRNRIRDKPCRAMGSTGRGSPCYRSEWLPQKLGSFVGPYPLHPLQLESHGGGFSGVRGTRDHDCPWCCVCQHCCPQSLLRAPVLVLPGSETLFLSSDLQTVATHKGEGTARTPSVWRAGQTPKADLQQCEGFVPQPSVAAFPFQPPGWLRSGGTNLSSHGRVRLPALARLGWGCLRCIK